MRQDLISFLPLQGGGSVCANCKPSASATPSEDTLTLMSDLLTGNWETAMKSELKNRGEASGLIAAYLQWHLERGLRYFAISLRDKPWLKLKKLSLQHRIGLAQNRLS
jgi:recombinational DNA repair protein (RecF pathway)